MMEDKEKDNCTDCGCESTSENSKNTANEDNKNDLSEKEDNSSSKKSKKNKKAISKLEKEISLLNEKNEEIKDKYLRLVAEYDNYRKRTAKEKLELREIATNTVLQELLPILDDFDRALEYCQKSTDENSITEGINIIHKKIKEFFKSKAIEEIDAMHKEFDTDFHEAVTKIPAPSKKLKGKVVDVIQKGYKLNDKVIRYSKVVVGE